MKRNLCEVSKKSRELIVLFPAIFDYSVSASKLERTDTEIQISLFIVVQLGDKKFLSKWNLCWSSWISRIFLGGRFIFQTNYGSSLSMFTVGINCITK